MIRKDSRGSVIIISLLVMTVVFILTTYSLQMAVFEAGIQSALMDRIIYQHRYENEVNRILYSGENGDFPEVIAEKILKSVETKQPQDITAEELGSKEKISCNVCSDGDMVTMEFSPSENSKLKHTTVQVVGSGLNPIYFNEKNIIYPNLLDETERKRLNIAFDSLPGFINTETLGSSSIYLSTVGAESVLFKKGTGYYDYVFEVFGPGSYYNKYTITKPTYILLEIIKGEDDSLSELIIDTKSSIISSKGILYVEGDIVVKSDFSFNGIIIIRSGNLIIEEGAHLKLLGKIISDTNLNFDQSVCTIKSADDLVGQLGMFLPGMYKPVIDYIKVY